MSSELKAQVPHGAFATRLNQVVDESGRVPPFNQGRYTWIKDQLEQRYGIEVTRETVRKWVHGETIPRNEKLRALAGLFDVDEGWLAFGVKTDADLKERRSEVLSDSGVVSVVAGLIQLSGGHCALPESGDENEFVDIYTIVARRQRMIAVRLGEDIGRDRVRFSVPNEFEKCKVIGVARTGFACFDLFLISRAQISGHGERRGPYIDVIASKREKGLTIGRSPLLKITDFALDLARADG